MIWFLLFISAILYPLAFIFSAHLWWLVFVFPLPLFYAAIKHNLTFKHGFFWGLITFSLHLSGPLYAAMLIAEGPWALRILPALIILIYQAFCTGIFFEIAHAVKIAPLITWCTTFMLFIIWIEQYCLWPFGLKEGYFLMHPLLPLAQHPQLLYPISMAQITEKSILTLLLLLVPVAGALTLHNKNKISACFFTLTCIPWIIGWYTPIKHQSPPEWLDLIHCLPHIAFSHSPHPSSLIRSIGKEFKKIIHTNPKIKIIIMPESAFNGAPFSQNPLLTELWNEKELGKKLHIILGTFRWHNNNYYNSAYLIYNGVTQCLFDKRHAMLLIERLPAWFNRDCIRNLYFHTSPDITLATSPRPLLNITTDISFVPYICSELFFNNAPDDCYHTTPILALCNDSAFITPYFPAYIHTLMFLTARFKAIQWQRDIMYVSYHFSAYINTNGELFYF